MSNENHNNTTGWKNKLEELSSLPGEAIFDKNASWGNLHQRLGGKKSSRKIIWYWMAAAGVLLAFMILFFNLNNDHIRIVKDEANQELPKKANVLPTPDIKKDSFKDITSNLAEKEKIRTLGDNKNYDSKNGANIAIPNLQKMLMPATIDTPIHVTDTVSNTVEEIQNLNAVKKPSESDLNMVTIISEKKKLRVVHINELGNPADQLPGLAHGRDTHSFQFRFANQVVYINSSPPPDKDGFIPLKSKTSPN